MITALRGAGISPTFEEFQSPDSFFAGGKTLAIHPHDDRRREAEYRIKMADDMPKNVEPGEETPEARWIDVTDYEPTALVELFKAQ